MGHQNEWKICHQKLWQTWWLTKYVTNNITRLITKFSESPNCSPNLSPNLSPNTLGLLYAQLVPIKMAFLCIINHKRAFNLKGKHKIHLFHPYLKSDIKCNNLTNSAKEKEIWHPLIIGNLSLGWKKALKQEIIVCIGSRKVSSSQSSKHSTIYKL